MAIIVNIIGLSYVLPATAAVMFYRRSPFVGRSHIGLDSIFNYC